MFSPQEAFHLSDRIELVLWKIHIPTQISRGVSDPVSGEYPEIEKKLLEETLSPSVAIRTRRKPIHLFPQEIFTLQDSGRRGVFQRDGVLQQI